MANKNKRVIKEAETKTEVTVNETEEPTKMRTAFIRVTYENNTKNEGTVTYTVHDIQEILEDWAKDKRMKYALICHHVHCHVVIKFNDATDFNVVKKKFPYGRIEVPGSKRFNPEEMDYENLDKSLRGCIRYLPHADQPEKRKNDVAMYGREYTIDDIITNDRAWIESFFETEKKTIEQIIDDNLTINSYIKEGRDLIVRGLITKKQYMKNKRFIDLSLDIYYETEMLPKIKKRNLNVIMVISPDGGTGKTSFIKEYCEMQGYSAYIACDRDPIQQYNGEDVLILDDARDETFKYREMLKLIDQFTGSPVGSRNVNGVFVGHTIVIITNQTLNEWYQNKISHAGQIGYENGTSFYRRLQEVWIFNKADFKVYNYKEVEHATKAMDYFEHKLTIENPITEEWRMVNKPHENAELLDPRLASKLLQIATCEKIKIKNAFEELEIEAEEEVQKAFTAIDDTRNQYANMLLEFQKAGYKGYPAVDYEQYKKCDVLFERDSLGTACDGKGHLQKVLFEW